MSNKQETELFEAEKWEHCTENLIRKTTLGAVFSIPLALVLASLFF